jgi:hypothetical protein
MITKTGARLMVLAGISLVWVALAAGAAPAGAAVHAAAVSAQRCPAPAPAPACAPCAPTITYLHHGCKVCCGCTPPIETALEVKDPSGCSCAPVIIPVCLPSCCTDVPQVTCHCGLLGRGVVRYDYCCGLTIKIVFRHTGDIVVHYIHG